MVTQLQPDVRAYLHGGEVIKRYIRVEEVAHEYGFSVEETEYIAKAASSLYKLTRIHLVKKERFDEFMKHIYKVPGTNKQIIKKFARIGEASIIYSIGRHRFIELARAAGATYKINEGTEIAYAQRIKAAFQSVHIFITSDTEEDVGTIRNVFENWRNSQ